MRQLAKIVTTYFADVRKIAGEEPGLDDLEEKTESILTDLLTQMTHLSSLATNIPRQQAEIGRLKSEIDKLSTAINQLQAGLAIERVAAWAFPSTRFGVRTYPIAPTDIDDVFLRQGILHTRSQDEGGSAD